MTVVPLRGLVAHNPLGFLCALGTLSLVTDRVGPEARLSWYSAGATWSPEVEAPGVDDEESLVRLLVSACEARDLSSELGWSKDVRLESRDDAREAIETAPPGRPLEMVAASVGELPLWGRREQPPYTPFRLIPLAGRAKFLAEALRQSATPHPQQLRGVLFDAWQYKSGVNALRLDPGARRQARALMAEAPSISGTNGVKGSVLLGVRGLGFFPLVPTTRGARIPGWPDRDSFVWPIWDVPLSERLVRLLLVLPWHSQSQTSPVAASTLKAHHVVARYRATRQVLGKDGAVFTWGEPLS